MTKQIVCVKWGRGYGPEYVNRLYGMASRHVTPPFRFVCLTDDRSGIRSEVECFDLPELGVPHPERTMGKWRKQVLWGASVPGLEVVARFVDFDSVIVDSIAAHCDAYWSLASKTMRTARSITSGENFGDFLIMAPFSIEGASSKSGAVHGWSDAANDVVLDREMQLTRR